MRIVEIIPKLFPCGGAETFLTTLSVSIKKQFNDDIHVICLYEGNNDNFLAKELLDNGITIHYLNKHTGVDFKCAKSLRKLLKEIKPDAIHLHLEVLITAMIGRIQRIAPVFYTFHSTASSAHYGRKNSFRNIVYRWYFRKRNVHCLSISKLVDNSIKKFFKVKNASIILNGVNLYKFSYKNNLNDRKITFLFAGRFVELKNTLCIIKAYFFTKHHFPDCNLTMLGTGPDMEKCKKFIDDNNVPDVNLVGFSDKANEYISNSQCLVLASSYEGNPIVINEAIASGTYVISSNVGGVPELLNETCGTMFEYDDINLLTNLSKKMKEFLTNKEAIVKKISKNIEENRNRVSIDSKAKQYRDLFVEKGNIHE
jgi:glycosyltransferase involved in cell wall biosynthesis